MLKKFKNNTMHTIGFILHNLEFHKPTGAMIMKYGDKYFWICLVTGITGVIGNII